MHSGTQLRHFPSFFYYITMGVKHILTITMAVLCNISGTLSQTHVATPDLTQTVADSNGMEQMLNDINRLPYGTRNIVVRIHADKPGHDCAENLFCYPTAHINNLAGTMPRYKRFAVTKEYISNDSMPGYVFNIVKYLRERRPTARIFISSANGNPDALENISHQMCIPFLKGEAEEAKTLIDKTENNSTRPNMGNILILGDSYSEQARWITHFKRMAKVQILNLAVGGATIKDKTDWKEEPYTAYPERTDNEGNHNTIGSQIEKLMRLIEGKELREGEEAIPGNYRPDIVFIQGGTNDNPDTLATDSICTDSLINDRTTFRGALTYITEKIRSLYPDSDIIFITPSGLYYGHTDTPFDFIVKAEQIRDVARLLNLRTIDWDMDGRLSFVFNNSANTGKGTQESPFIYNRQTRETSDLLHPNTSGAIFLAESVFKALSEQ